MHVPVHRLTPGDKPVPAKNEIPVIAKEMRGHIAHLCTKSMFVRFDSIHVTMVETRK